MAISTRIRDVFGHFQNLNLLALLQDLSGDEVVRHSWFSGGQLCPIAHGLPAGKDVQKLIDLGQAHNLKFGSDYAASCLGADTAAVYRFVRSWDDGNVSHQWMVQQLQDLWEERK